MKIDTAHLREGIVKNGKNFISGAELGGAECLGLCAQSLYESAIKLNPLERIENARVTYGNLSE